MAMVSGGQDSVALLHVLASGRVAGVSLAGLHALHVNHQLRGEESEADESLVTETCSRLGVDLTVLQRPVDKTQGNVQEIAREARRAAGVDVAGSLECGRIALGHTADDQAETLLYRVARYGGLSALAGMRPSEPPWVRPLLDCRREETAAYCRENGLEFARDSGNTHPGYVRTHIRESILPAWEAVLPGAVEAACRTAEVAAEMKDLAGEVSASAMAEVRANNAGGIGGSETAALRCGALLALSAPVRRLLLHDWLGKDTVSGASRAAVLAVESLLEARGSASCSLFEGRRVVKEYDLVWIETSADESRVVPGPIELPVPGRVRWGNVEITSESCEGFRAVEIEEEAIIDADAVSQPLWVRGPCPGDRIRPLGSAGSRKLKNVLIDRKVPARERPWRPLVVCGERILWVGGLIISEEARVTEKTSRFLRLSLRVVD